MNDWINDFLARKPLSKNSAAAYGYDLQAFCELVGDTITEHKLRWYQESLSTLAISAQKRKVSAVNQFLYYLYETGKVARFYKLTVTQTLPEKKVGQERLPLDCFYQATHYPQGQLIALLIVELGLLPTELVTLQVAQIDTELQVMMVKRGQTVRVLQFPKRLLPYLTWLPDQVYLFDKKGQAYSRQWAFRELNRYLASLGLSELTAQDLREQYILGQVAHGVTAWDLAKKLGLKTIATLNKYYK